MFFFVKPEPLSGLKIKLFLDLKQFRPDTVFHMNKTPFTSCLISSFSNRVGLKKLFDFLNSSRIKTNYKFCYFNL